RLKRTLARNLNYTQHPTRRGSMRVSAWVATPFQPVVQTLITVSSAKVGGGGMGAVSLLCLHDSLWRMVVGKLRNKKSRRNSRGELATGVPRSCCSVRALKCSDAGTQFDRS